MNLPDLPKISIGTRGFGNEYGKMTYGDCKQIIDKALLNRINYIDTSPMYGEGLSEEIVGKCLYGVSRERYIISTSAGRSKQNSYSYTYYNIANSVMNSLKKLGSGYIDIVFINDIEYADNLDIIINESIPALLYLRKQGYVKYIGLSSMFLEKIDYVVSKCSYINYIQTYCNYTLINDTLTQYAPNWNSRGIKIIHGGVTSMGLLTPQGPPITTPAPSTIKDICKKMNEFCHENRINIVEKSFYFTLGYQRISTILLGVTSTKELDDYFSWLDRQYCNNKIYINTLIEMAKPIKNHSWFF